MEFLFDTANLAEIKKAGEIFPYTGVTTNPSIICKESGVDFFEHLRALRALIGERTLHVQVTATDCAGIIREAEAIRGNIDERVYIKIPASEQGIAAMARLKQMGYGVTATAIYSKIQGFMSIAAGADYLATYCNRMENLDVDFRDVTAALREMIDRNGVETKIVAASFKNIAQVNDALRAGSHCATVAPSILHAAFASAAIKKAVDDFGADWQKTYGGVSIDRL